LKTVSRASGKTKPTATVPQAPVLVLAGQLDPSPRPDKAAQVAALFPRGEFILQPGAAHYPWLDDPTFFARTVSAFLNPSHA
jgi:pimeloyl-ACP methyl ester carboxylesterase